MLSTLAKSVIAGLVALVALSGHAMAHAALVDATEIAAVAVQARYDTGEPMAAAQVAVFAPGDPAQPWRVGQTDAAGQYVFTPDGRAGRWAVQVRQAGHGAITYVDVGQAPEVSMVASRSGVSGTSPLQRLLMVACVFWGCLGTALYFRSARHARLS